MTNRPIHTTGILRSTNGAWQLQLDEADPSFADAMPVRLVLWDARQPKERSEIERIAIAQQLEAGIVALALGAEGALAASRS